MATMNAGFQELSGERLKAAVDLHDRLFADVFLTSTASTQTRFPLVRIALLADSLTCFGNELEALADASRSTGEQRVYVRWEGLVDHGAPSKWPAEGAVATTMDALVKASQIEDTQFDSYRWSIYAMDGSWIANASDYGEVWLLAGDRSFLADYLAARPEAPEDILRWLCSLGACDPAVERFLSREYGVQAARELWRWKLEADELSGPIVFDVEREIGRLKDRRPELVERLRQIWNGA